MNSNSIFTRRHAGADAAAGLQRDEVAESLRELSQMADEAQAGRVRAELARFLENPADPRYLAASWQSGHTNSGLHYQRFPFLATLRHNAGPFTWGILFACIAVFLLQTVIGDQPVMLLLAWPYDPSLKFEVWRYFSHALMHFSLMHILFNLLWWWYQNSRSAIFQKRNLTEMSLNYLKRK